MVKQQGEASYLALLRSGELHQRVEQLERLLESCTVCPRDCLNNRLHNDIAACYSGRLPIVSSYPAHFGEEPPLVGTGGAGNIFFGNCNRSEEHTSELQSRGLISYAVFCLKKKKT